MKQVVDKMNLKEITIAYGMTETSPISFQTEISDPLDKRISTVGRVRPHLEVKLINEQGAIVPIGQVGELCVKGYAVMKQYWEDAENTDNAVEDGWMHTGDLAILDEDGYCTIVGRLKDMLIRGGENIYPKEIEDVLFQHPAIQSAQVFGVPDAKYGEEVCTWIVLRQGTELTAEDVRAHCRRYMAYYKIPRYVKFVDNMPLTVTGKPKKFVMREMMIDELQLTSAKTV
jgi:fatty-acyl-CoA synthase